MDLDNMIFSMGSTFIFGSWICEAGDDGKLQSRLLKDSDHHEDVFCFDDYDRSSHWKIRAARDVRFNSGFATLRIRLEFRLRIQDGV